MHPVGCDLHIVVGLGVFQQIHAELVEAQVHDGDAVGHVFQVHHFLLQPLELGAAVFQVALLLLVDQVIVTGGGHDRDLHAGLDTAFQVDVLVQVHVRPKVDQLDTGVFAADTVDPAKPLDDAHRVPVDVIVDEVVTVLQVLALADAVGGDEDVQRTGIAGHQVLFVLGDGRKAGQHGVQVAAQAGDDGAPLHITGHFRRVQTKFFLGIPADVLVEVIRRIRKGGEDDEFSVVGVDRVGDLLVDQVKQLPEFTVMRRGDVGHHEKQQLQRFGVRLKVAQPGQIVHIGQIDLDLAANSEKVGVLVIGIPVLGCRQVVQFQHLPAILVVLDGGDGIRDQLVDAFQRKAEGIDRAFQPFEQVDTHQAANTLLAALLGQAVAFVVGLLYILGQTGRLNVVGRSVNAEVERVELLVDVLVVDGPGQVGQAGAQRDRLEPPGKLTNVRHVVVFLDMAAGPGNGHTVQQGEKVEVQHGQEFLGGALAGRELAPGIESFLRLAENLVNGLLGVQFAIEFGSVALIGKGKLVAQVNEAVVDRRC